MVIMSGFFCEAFAKANKNDTTMLQINKELTQENIKLRQEQANNQQCKEAKDQHARAILQENEKLQQQIKALIDENNINKENIKILQNQIVELEYERENNNTNSENTGNLTELKTQIQRQQFKINRLQKIIENKEQFNQENVVKWRNKIIELKQQLSSEKSNKSQLTLMELLSQLKVIIKQNNSTESSITNAQLLVGLLAHALTPQFETNKQLNDQLSNDHYIENNNKSTSAANAA